MPLPWMLIFVILFFSFFSILIYYSFYLLNTSLKMKSMKFSNTVYFW